MDWNTAKNYTIILLLVLNALLLGLNLTKYMNKRLSNTEVGNITTVLSNNGISVEADIPKNSGNLPQLTLGADGYNLFELVDLFFESNISVKRTEEFNVTIFKAGSKTLRVNAGTITFTDSDTKAYSREEAEKKASGYIEAFGTLFPGFKHELSRELEEGYKIEYNMYYKGKNCFNNICIFRFDENGLTIKLKYSEPLGFTGLKSEVCRADVALYSFMNNVKELYPGESFTVTEISVGYYAENEQGNSKEEALPYYRIRTAEKDEIYYINGYTGNFSGG
ncbi:MAG: two-component system regulatory protein YycI [Clostridiales bacterium]|nr:two-component system regulatory protein YycI [Clostridiales bacterium]